MGMRKGFTPLETIGKQERDRVSLTGFTLVEIMIVVAIIIILVTIAVPNILRSRLIAYEGLAIANLKAINTACQAFHIDEERYPDTLTELSSASPPYIDNELGSGQKQGYEFVYELVDQDHFTVNANPLHTGLLKGRYFFLDETGIIRANSDGPAGADDEIVG